MLALLQTPRFGPLFATQFLGAFNDNLFKTAMLFLITYHLAANTSDAATLITAAAGVFIVPYFLFSGVAGEIADGHDKAQVARWVKLAELGLMAVGAVALLTATIPLMFVVLFGLGVHSTIFGPIKYAILPQHLRDDELLGGTGLIEGATFIAILLGQLAGGLLGTPWACAAMLGCAGLGIIAAKGVPPAPATAAVGVDWNPWTASRGVLGEAFAVRKVFLAALAISWFWGLGTVFISQFVPLVKGDVDASEAVATLLLVVFTVGVAIGAVAVGRLLHGHASMRAAPWAAIGMALASLDLLVSVAGAAPPAGSGPIGIPEFLAHPGAWRLIADLFVFAVAGGVFSVPLYVVLQTAGGAATRSRTIAATNIVTAAVQVAATLVTGAAVAAGAPIAAVLAASGATALLVIPLLRRI